MAGENRTGRVKKLSAPRSRGPRPARRPTAGPPSARRWCRMRRRTASSRSVGIGRAFFEATAGVDESFVRDGGADTECAGRAQVRRRAARAGAACRRRSGAGGRARARAPRADAGRGGAGVPWTDPGRGIRAAWHARGRRGHEDGGFRERGLSGTLRGGLASAAHPAIAGRPACAPGGPRGSAAGLQPIASPRAGAPGRKTVRFRPSRRHKRYIPLAACRARGLARRGGSLET